MHNSYWQHEWLLKLTHTHTHPACALSSAVLNVGVLMLGKFLSRLVDEERCQADSCSDFTFPSMRSGFGNSGESLPGTDTHIHIHTHSEKHMYLAAHMHQPTITHTHIYRVGAAELERLDVTGLIIEGCPLKLLHTRAQKIKLSYQWAAHPKKKSPLSSSLFFFSLFFYLSPSPFPCLSWKAGLKFCGGLSRLFNYFRCHSWWFKKERRERWENSGKRESWE